LRVESVEENVSNSQSDEYPNPIFLGSEIERYGPLAPQSYFDFEGGSIVGGTRDPEVYDHTPKILLQSIRNLSLERRLVPVVDEEGYHFGGNVVGILLKKEVELDAHYLQAVIASNLINQFFRHRFTTISLTSTFLSEIPIREIEFTTPEDEREAHVNTLIDAYEEARAAHVAPTEADVLDAATDHLDADRTDVVHDLLAHLARTMTDLKAERATYDLDVTNWMAPPAEGAGVGLRTIGRYQPAEGAPASLLADTTDARDGLRVGRLVAEQDDDGDTHTVHVRATARFKPQGERSEWPEAVPDDAEPDQWGYVETAPLPVCTLHDCTEIEAGLVVHWCAALNDADSGFSGYRDNATKTNSLLDRLYDARFPDPDSSRDALRPFLDNAQQAAALDRQIAFTDGLIDQIVYRLYGLTDEEVAVVENT
jgi:hypothetical protein